LLKKHADSILHPPQGSNVPGKVDPNPYVYYPPADLRGLLTTVTDEEELEKIDRALNQWERQYQFPVVYPWKRAANKLRLIAHNMVRLAEIVGPAQNIPYYQDAEVPSGENEVIDDDRGLYDNDNMERFDIPRQGERPDREIDTAEGDFSGPHDPIFPGVTVKPRGDGIDPEGLEYPFPPTGGDIDSWPNGI